MELARARLDPEIGEKERGESEGGAARRGGLHLHDAGERGGQHGAAGEEDTAWRGSGQHCGDREDGVFAKNPLPPFPLIAKRSSSKFRDLIKALGHFYKICKNSHRLYLTFRCSTKFGLAK